MGKQNWIIALLSGVLLGTSWSCATEATVEQKKSPIGVWDLECLDGDGTKWFATLVLFREGTGSLAGRADWLGDNGASGREHLTGTFDGETRTISFRGTSMEFGDRIVRCEYTATVSRSGDCLEQGKMSREGVTMTGSWRASRISS